MCSFTANPNVSKFTLFLLILLFLAVSVLFLIFRGKQVCNWCLEPVSYASVEEDGTSGLVIEVFNDLDKVGADVVLLHGCSQSCMPNPVSGPLEVFEDMVEIRLMLEIFLTLTENA